MPKLYQILIDALARIAGSNDSDQINEIAHAAARQILSRDALAYLREQDGRMPTPGMPAPSNDINGYSSSYDLELREIMAGDLVIEPAANRDSEATLEVPLAFGNITPLIPRFARGMDIMSEIFAARMLAKAASAAMSRCTETLALDSARARLELERDEVRHRLKNVYASAIGLANLSLPREHAADFSSRLRALAGVHHYLDVDGRDSGKISVKDLLEVVLSPYQNKDFSRVVAEGPEIMLDARRAAALGLLVNELATNALKHGSLSLGCGKVLLQWTVADDELGFWWREIGGPEVDTDASPNQGSRLTQLIVEKQLRGKMARRLTPTGFEFSAMMPIG